MPVKLRVAKRRSHELPIGGEYDLTLGPVEGRSAFASYEEMREAWEQHRDALMSGSFGVRPGHRPWGFWEFDFDGDIPPEVTSQEEAVYLYLADDRERREIEALWKHNIAYARLHHPNDLAAARKLAHDWGTAPYWFFDKAVKAVPMRRRARR
jgi:hypothetical protein